MFAIHLLLVLAIAKVLGQLFWIGLAVMFYFKLRPSK
jgi:hypothetical protein